MGKVDEVSKLRLLLQQYSPDLLEQCDELLWLREQVGRAEKLDPHQTLAQFKAYLQQKTTKAMKH
jgi:hypothetical protein